MQVLKVNLICCFHGKLTSFILMFNSEEFLNLIQCSIPLNNECKWLSDIVRDNNRTSHPLRHLVLARFLDIPLHELFNEEPNIVTANYGISMEKEYESTQNKDILNKLWEGRLKILIKRGFSLRQIAKELNSIPKTVKKQIGKLNIEPFWKDRGGRRYGDKDYKETQEFREKQKECRERWVSLMKLYPNKSRNELKLIDLGLGTWLTRNDKEWMVKNSPDIRAKHKPVDWSKRDKEILSQVEMVVEDMKSGKPERICWTTIGSKLGISGWLRKKREQIPLTQAYIDSVEESISQFQVRKIEWAVEQLGKSGKSITYWRLLETAGVKERYIENTRGQVEVILSKKGYNYDFLDR